MNSLKKLAPYTMAITHFGMAWLYLGLGIALAFEVSGNDLAMGWIPSVGHMPPAYVLANGLWIVGAAILILPPLIDDIEILVVLEVFLVISGFMSYWQPESLVVKIASRICMSLMAVGYLKWRGLLNDFKFPWSLLNPAFYWRAWNIGDNRALAVGLEMLGIGYALSSMVMLTIGSAFLARSAWLGYRNTGKAIFKPWTTLNFAYTTAGVIIVYCQQMF